MLHPLQTRLPQLVRRRPSPASVRKNLWTNRRSIIVEGNIVADEVNLLEKKKNRTKENKDHGIETHV